MRRRLSILMACLGVLGLLVMSACSGGNNNNNNNTTCKEDGDCKSGETCKSGKCETKGNNPECSNDADCTGGKVCKSGKCEDNNTNPECTKDGDCTDGKVCTGGKCTAKGGSCNSDADCSGDKKRCEVVSKACVQCLTNGDCESTQECKQNVCEAKQTSECASDDDCKDKPQKYCSDGKKCEWDCKADENCATGQTCVSGACKDKVQGCTDDSSCTDASLPKCDATAKKCVECLADGDCKDSTKSKCNNNVCQAKAAGCNPACSADQYCFNDQRCLPKAKACQAAADCAATEQCINPGSGTVCLTKCDPTQNKSADDPSNSACWSGFGHCFGASQTDPKAGVCLPPPQKIRDLGESCQNLSEPEKPDYHTCKDTLICIRAGTATTCWKKCDPKNNAGGDATKDDINPDCKAADGEGTCRVLQSGGGACDPRLAKRAKGESCELEDATDPGYHGCKSGLFCNNKVCVDGCDPDKADSCGANRHCYRSSGSGYCVDKCDPANGVVKTTECKAGFYCYSSTLYKPGYCRALPAKKQGTKQVGETCSTFTASEYCDGSKDLVCKSSTCLKGCDPKQSTSGCATDEECVEDTTYSHLGGICLAKATQKLGDACDDTSKRCSTGLQCYLGRCEKQCDPNKAAPGDCGANEHCYRSSPQGVCVGKCDPANGATKNTACKDLYYCTTSSTYSPGYCRALPDNKKQGTKQLGEDCSNFTVAKFCDGSSGLYCKFPNCAKACNFKQGGPECSATEECVEDTLYSYLGGACLAKPTQKVGEACDEISKRCNTGLICNNKVCAVKCDPDKAPPGDCGASERCVRASGGGACVSATQKDGEACDANKLCVSGYTCVTFDSANSIAFCKQECDPTVTTNNCATGTKCLALSQFDPKAGACIEERKQSQAKGDDCFGGDPSKPSYNDCVAGQGCDSMTSKCVDGLKKHEACGTSVGKPCASEFTCAGSQASGSYYCLDKCDPKASACATGYTCVPLSSATADGVCAQSCTADTDCTAAGKKCTDIPDIGKICI